MPQIPLSPRRRERLLRFLKEQLSEIQGGWESRCELYRRYVARYEAKTRRRTYPMANASSLHIPLVAAYMDSKKAKITNQLKAQSDRMVVGVPFTDAQIGGVVNPTSGSPITWRDASELLERYCLWEVSPSGEVDLDGWIDTSLDDMLLLGTTAGKGVYGVTASEDYIPGAGLVTTSERANFRMLRIPVENLIVPPHYAEVEDCPLIFHRYTARPSSMLLRSRPSVAEDIRFNEIEVKKFLRKHAGEAIGDMVYASGAELSPAEKEQIAREGVSEQEYYTTSEQWVCETWARFDLDGTGTEQRLLIDHDFNEWAPESIFSVRNWPTSLSFTKSVYIRRRDRFHGMGIPERMESIDEGVSANINQTIDAANIANGGLIRARKDSPAVQTGAFRNLYAGKVIPVSDATDFDIVPMGSLSPPPAAFEVGSILERWGQQVAKISDYNMGQESSNLGRQGTATSTLALLGENGSYDDNTTRSFRRAGSRMCLLWQDAIVRNKPFDRIRMALGTDADLLVAVLSALSPGEVRSKMQLSIGLSSPAASRELARQEEAAKWQLVTQFYQGLIQLAGLRMQQPIIAALVDVIGRDGILRMKRLLDAWGESTTSHSLPDWDRDVVRYANAAQASIQSQQQPGAGGPNGGAVGGEAPPPTNGSAGGAVEPSGGGLPPGAPGAGGAPAAGA